MEQTNPQEFGNESKLHFIFNFISNCVNAILKTLGIFKDAEDLPELIAINYSDLQMGHFLDSGAHGNVYLAKLNNETVAVKKLRSKCAIVDFAHFRKLSHPNIVTFKGACESPTSETCLIMEYCPAGQLCQYLAKTESLTPSLLADWSRQIASGMAYLHGCSIIHCDLKSPNVLISEGKLKIGDIDGSQQMHPGENQRQMSTVGTVAWMAPEFILNEQCTKKIDIWSYGVILWELCKFESNRCTLYHFANHVCYSFFLKLL